MVRVELVRRRDVDPRTFCSRDQQSGEAHRGKPYTRAVAGRPHDSRRRFVALSAAVVTVAAAGTLAVGIAATTTLFTTVNTVLLRPLPYARPGDLYSLRTYFADGASRWGWSPTRSSPRSTPCTTSCPPPRTPTGWTAPSTPTRSPARSSSMACRRTLRSLWRAGCRGSCDRCE